MVNLVNNYIINDAQGAKEENFKEVLYAINAKKKNERIKWPYLYGIIKVRQNQNKI